MEPAACLWGKQEKGSWTGEEWNSAIKCPTCLFSTNFKNFKDLCIYRIVCMSSVYVLLWVILCSVYVFMFNLFDSFDSLLPLQELLAQWRELRLTSPSTWLSQVREKGCGLPGSALYWWTQYCLATLCNSYCVTPQMIHSPSAYQLH